MKPEAEPKIVSGGCHCRVLERRAAGGRLRVRRIGGGGGLRVQLPPRVELRGKLQN